MVGMAARKMRNWICLSDWASLRKQNINLIIQVICEKICTGLHWNLRVVMMPTLSSLVAPEVVVMTTPGATSDVKVCVMMISLSSLVASEVVIMTTSDATSDDKVGIITPLGFIPVPFVSRYFTCMSGPGRAWPQRSGGIYYPFIVLHKIFMTLPRYFTTNDQQPIVPWQCCADMCYYRDAKVVQVALWSSLTALKAHIKKNTNSIEGCHADCLQCPHYYKAFVWAIFMLQWLWVSSIHVFIHVI